MPNPGTIPGFPTLRAPGGDSIALIDGGGSNSMAAVSADSALWVSGPVVVSILAEMRVASYLWQVIANVADDLAQLRADAVADMGTLYAAPQTTPVPSS
jgi:hypothetical protein